MTKITGIIAEFNPFHNGHQHLLAQADGLKIVVMSGNWDQRGAPAIFDKWTRAEMALENGADLVVEMPTLVSVQAADFFASGSVDILAELGVEELVFGSETAIDYNEITALYEKKADQMNAFIENLPDEYSYPEKTQLMWEHFSTVKFDGNTPNHVLGLAYAKACANKKIRLRAVARTGSEHGSQDMSMQSRFASGTALRTAILDGQPADEINRYSPSVLTEVQAVDWSAYFDLLRYKIISTEDLTTIFQVNEELSSRLKKQIKVAKNFDELVTLVHTKRYTKARVRRILTYLLLDIKPDFTLPKQIHVLGFTAKGQQHLRSVSEKTIVRIGQQPWDSVTQKADAIYQLGSNQLLEQNHGRKPIIK
ncbi:MULTISPECIES: nucleotidyltransferase [unclassified Lactococcus]|uniref:nucleotidyltransferase n=1 Tax=unclassified Lactococcus TaxID=2643510 RepID=UPI0011CA68F5|nr:MULTISPECIES: nucleotidyltransferase [unclassified Lactococcus]MQW23297.1 nucleotidyltransferase [Lactococcus sp. dk101]TXK38037.1 nucleotidyltransferase [Lactococcus sp. dk310]TXK49716.1 nucleotidyltransferase [Lactococcus sp. dk322]